MPASNDTKVVLSDSEAHTMLYGSLIDRTNKGAPSIQVNPAHVAVVTAHHGPATRA
ncbi:hypothetical protein [Oryzomonas sagensis]|uniref:hypothetical protein n=1 Tax=Oryzomonas sagensis TaxID=2603857 RepID=UPI00177F341E|nr:hypothetical protein [Oryzomonas sagensis]